MAEKILNTRIALKIDTLENWQKSTLGLKKGELAIATVAATAGTGLTEPVCMIKIGEDGVKTFSQLEWNVYAKSSDVLAACKTEAGLKAFVNGVIGEAGIATDEAMQELAGKVTTAEGKITTLEGTVGDADKGLVKDVATLNGLVGDKKVADQISEAITNLDLANTYAAKEHKHTKADITDFAHNHEMSEINGLSAEFAKKVDKETGKSLVADTEIARLAAMSDGANKVEASATNGNIKIDGVETVVYTHPEKHAIAEVDGLQAALNGKQDVIPANTYDAYGSAEQALEDANSYTDGKIEAMVGTETVSAQIATNLENALKIEKDGTKVDKYALATDLADARAIADANATAITTLNGDANTEGSVDYKVAQEVAKILNDNDASDIDTLNEIAAWIKNDTAGVGDLNRRVTDNTTAIATLNGDASTAGSVDKKIADAIAAENLSQYATDTELEALDGRVEDVEAELNTATTGLKARMTQAETDIVALETKVGDETVAAQIEAAIEALKIGDYAKAADLTAAINQHNTDKAALEAEIAKKANDADLAAIAKTGNVNDLVQTTGDVLIFDCGGSV